MMTSSKTVVARVRPAQYQPDRGRGVVNTVAEAAAYLDVSESSVRRAISRAGFRGRVAGGYVAGMIELWNDFGDAVGLSVFLTYADSTSHQPTAEDLAR